MLTSFKTEIKPTDAQRIKIHQTIGVCRYIYNLFIEHNKENHENGKPYVSGKSFEKWLNHTYMKKNPDKSWIKDVSSKSVKKSMENAHTAFQRFFKGKAGFPNFKKKNDNDVKMYFVKDNKKDCLCERHRIKIPTLGWIRLKEKGYIPQSRYGHVIKSGTVSMHAGRYYVSVVIDMPDIPIDTQPQSEPIGIDLGLKEFAVVSNGDVYPNINKTRKIQRLEKKLKRENRKLSRKLKNLKKGESTRNKANIKKQVLRIQKIYQRLYNIRTDYINQIIAGLVRTKPAYIAIEDLNVSGMMKNRHLSHAVASQKFYEFRVKLIEKRHRRGIEVRIVNRWYPSSKTCHACGNVKKNLKLSERIYRCTCGYVNDRDMNASLNIRDTDRYQIA